MWKKIVAMSLVLVMVLPFTACEEGAEEAGLPPAEEIINGVLEAQDDIRAYEFEMDMTMNMAGEAEGEVLEGTIAVDFNGAIDLDNRQMRMEMAMDMAMTGEDEMAMAMEMYLVDNMGYIFMAVPGEEPVWQKSEVPETGWDEIIQQFTPTEPQIDLLEAAQVEVLRSEKVKGVDCYVLQLTPDMDQLWQAVMRQAAFGGQGIPLPEVPEELLDEAFSDFSVKQWVAKDTYFLMKVELDMTMKLTAEAMEVTEGEMTMDITLSFLAYNYNETISIVVPPEAEAATEMPSPVSTRISALISIRNAVTTLEKGMILT